MKHLLFSFLILLVACSEPSDIQPDPEPNGFTLGEWNYYKIEYYSTSDKTLFDQATRTGEIHFFSDSIRLDDVTTSFWYAKYDENFAWVEMTSVENSKIINIFNIEKLAEEDYRLVQTNSTEDLYVVYYIKD